MKILSEHAELLISAKEGHVARAKVVAKKISSHMEHDYPLDFAELKKIGLRHTNIALDIISSWHDFDNDFYSSEREKAEHILFVWAEEAKKHLYFFPSNYEILEAAKKIGRPENWGGQ